MQGISTCCIKHMISLCSSNWASLLSSKLASQLFQFAWQILPQQVMSLFSGAARQKPAADYYSASLMCSANHKTTVLSWSAASTRYACVCCQYLPITSKHTDSVPCSLCSTWSCIRFLSRWQSTHHSSWTALGFLLDRCVEAFLMPILHWLHDGQKQFVRAVKSCLAVLRNIQMLLITHCRYC